MRLDRISIPARALCLAISPLLALGAGCSVLVGNIKPVDQKSDDYKVLNLNKDNADWVKLEATATDSANGNPEGTNSAGISDVAYQSKKTASIISLNSACRPKHREQNDLREFSRLLFLGISDVTSKTEKDITVQNRPALETTLMGKLNGQSMVLRTVVLRRDECIYDLMYVAEPPNFPTQAQEFSRFVSSLRLD